MFITHEGDPATVDGIARVDSERKAPKRRSRCRRCRTPRSTSAGWRQPTKDMSDGARYDLLIAVVSSLTLIFMIMLILTEAWWPHS